MKIQKHYLALSVALLLSGCLPFNQKQSEVNDHIAQQKQAAQRIADAYEMELREIKPYTGYNYEKDRLDDPFRARDFVLELDNEPTQPGEPPEPIPPECRPPTCVPPDFARERELLEEYSLDALAFVGTLRQNNEVALIKTPNHGVVEIGVGNYLGKNYGQVLEIRETALIIQEKIRSGGLWEDKKTVMVIKQ